MVKYFCYKDSNDLENMINKYLTETPKIVIKAISHNVYSYEGEIWHSALMVYDITKKE